MHTIYAHHFNYFLKFNLIELLIFITNFCCGCISLWSKKSDSNGSQWTGWSICESEARSRSQRQSKTQDKDGAIQSVPSMERNVFIVSLHVSFVLFSPPGCWKQACGLYVLFLFLIYFLIIPAKHVISKSSGQVGVGRTMAVDDHVSEISFSISQKTLPWQSYFQCMVVAGHRQLGAQPGGLTLAFALYCLNCFWCYIELFFGWSQLLWAFIHFCKAYVMLQVMSWGWIVTANLVTTFWNTWHDIVVSLILLLLNKKLR